MDLWWCAIPNSSFHLQNTVLRLIDYWLEIVVPRKKAALNVSLPKTERSRQVANIKDLASLAPKRTGSVQRWISMCNLFEIVSPFEEVCDDVFWKDES